MIRKTVTERRALALTDFRTEEREDVLSGLDDLAELPAVARAIGANPRDGNLAERLHAAVPALASDPFGLVAAEALAQRVMREWPAPDAQWWGQPISDNDRAWQAALRVVEGARRLASGRSLEALEDVPPWWFVGLLLGFPQGLVSRRTVNYVMEQMRKAETIEEAVEILQTKRDGAIRRAERRRLIAERTGPNRKRESARRALYREASRTHT